MVAVDEVSGAHAALDLVARHRVDAPTYQPVARALAPVEGAVGIVVFAALGHVAPALALIHREQLREHSRLVAGGNIERLAAVQSAAVRLTALLHLATLQIVTARRPAHDSHLRGRVLGVDAGALSRLLDLQGRGTADPVIVARLHQTLEQRRTTGFSRIGAAKERPLCSGDGERLADGAELL